MTRKFRQRYRKKQKRLQDIEQAMWCIEKSVHEEFFHNRKFYYTAKVNEGVKGQNYTTEDCIHNKIYFNVDAHLKVITHDRGAFA